MEVRNIILHHIIKELGGKPTVKPSKKVMPLNEAVNGFVKTLIKSYGTKNPSQGTFQTDKTNYPFQTICNEYLKNKDFISFTTNAMNILKRAIDIPSTTGGYVVFVHYTENKKDFIITVMLDKSAQFVVDDDNLGIEMLMALDIEKLARANRINIDRWSNGEPLYLSFIKGTREVSKYFIQFIGATDVTSSKENFTKLRNAIDDYNRDKNIPKDQKESTREAISNYIKKCHEEDIDVNLVSISAIMNSESPEDFTNYLNENNLEVSGNISINKASDYDTFVRNRVKEKGYSLVFEKALIKSKKIMRQGNNIVISNIPTEILDHAFKDQIENNESRTNNP